MLLYVYCLLYLQSYDQNVKLENDSLITNIYKIQTVRQIIFIFRLNAMVGDGANCKCPKKLIIIVEKKTTGFSGRKKAKIV